LETHQNVEGIKDYCIVMECILNGLNDMLSKAGGFLKNSFIIYIHIL